MISLHHHAIDSANSIAVITFNRPKKLNAWNEPLLDALRSALRSAASDSSVSAAVLTGTGRYYSSGYDFGARMNSAKPTMPSVFLSELSASNERLFEMFIGFPKVLVCACNGPAVGAAVTSALLCDFIVCSDSATFLTPFTSLGITPEGCSTFTFEDRMGAEGASRVLNGEKISASDAISMGFVDMVVPGNEVLEQSLRIARDWVLEKRPKRYAQQVHILRRHNKEESDILARSFLQRPFLEKLYNMSSGVGQKAAFWVAMRIVPWMVPRL